MIKIMFLCATKSGYSIIKYMNENHKNLISCVLTFKDINVRQKWNLEIKRYCRKNKIFFIEYRNLKTDLKKYIIHKKITNIITTGWKYLIPLEANKLLKNEVVVFHDSLLPEYAGFSPTPTAIICGEKEIGLTVLFARNGIDKGDIILQKK